jgi:hypothetical protein
MVASRKNPKMTFIRDTTPRSSIPDGNDLIFLNNQADLSNANHQPTLPDMCFLGWQILFDSSQEKSPGVYNETQTM